MAHFPDNILTALKEAVINVFWKKSDVRSLFSRCEVPHELISAQDWNAYKFHIVSPVLDALNSSEEGLGPLRRILQGTLEYKDGAHLLWVQDGQKRKREAERCLEHLRLLVKDYDSAKRTEREQREARQRQAQEEQGKAAFNSRLGQIYQRFLGYHQNPNRQERGYALEEILYDAFLFFELNPQGAFRRVGEQIDGAFYHDGNHFLLEAKWTSSPSNLSDLRDLDGAVGSSLDNTLGLFVSLNGFTKESLDAYAQGSRPKLICMDGMDLMAVLNGQIDLSDLLKRKRDIAVQRRLIFASVTQIMTGKF